jgi:hypothetical protein
MSADGAYQTQIATGLEFFGLDRFLWMKKITQPE